MSNMDQKQSPTKITIQYSDGKTFETETDAFVLVVAPSPTTESGIHTVLYGSGWDVAALQKIADMNVSRYIMKHSENI